MQSLQRPPEDNEVARLSNATKLAGAVAALALGVLILLLTVAAMEVAQARESRIVAVGTSFAAPLAGLLIAGWKLPLMFLQPLQRLRSVLFPWLRRKIDARLTHPVQRALFVLSVVTALPWALLGLIGESFKTSTVKEYFRSTFYPLFNTLFEVHTWGYEPRWFDWSLVLSLVALLLAFTWRFTCQPLARWAFGKGEK
jgi:hypothetical protein